MRSVSINDPGQGLAGGVLDDCQVLIWWGHVRNGEIEPEVGQSIVERIKAGRLSLIALHSAHWSTPFVEAMYERTRFDAAGICGRWRAIAFKSVMSRRRSDTPFPRRTRGSRLMCGGASTPTEPPRRRFICRTAASRPIAATASRATIRVLRPDHPIVQGVPRDFQIPQTEMYDEPFHVPEPDEVILEERWASGEWFRSGAIWKLGQGRVFYFRPGHETYPIYKQPIPLRILTNAVRWLGSGA